MEVEGEAKLRQARAALRAVWSPKIREKQGATDAVLQRAGKVLKPLPEAPPMPGTDSDSSQLHGVLSQLVVGMNEVRSSLSTLVTREDFKDLAATQREEMHTYVDSRFEPLREEVEEVKAHTATQEDLAELKEKYDKLVLRITELEAAPGSKASKLCARWSTLCTTNGRPIGVSETCRLGNAPASLMARWSTLCTANGRLDKAQVPHMHACGAIQLLPAHREYAIGILTTCVDNV